MVDVIIDDARVRAGLNNLLAAGLNLRPALVSIGEILKESTQKRFMSTTAPDGSAWLLNSVLSTLLYKDGDRPLTDDGTLGNTINYQILDANSVAVGSPMEYAAMQQFGGTKSEFPNLWGDVPARPFLGLSDDDSKQILEMIHDYLLSSIS